MRSIAILRTTLAAGLIGLLAGCGAGGGGGTSAYSITLRADRTSLPLNIAGVAPSIGGPYTTTLYVSATDSSGNPIPGGTSTFSCAITGSLDSGALYYLDGVTSHQTKTTNADGTTTTTDNAYRSITLDSNSGGATFHYSSTNVAGTASIQCAVTDANNVQQSASTSIQVGGNPSGKASQIVATVSSPNYLSIQGVNGQTQLVIQETVYDEAGQLITPAAGVDNLQVRIVPDPNTLAENDAQLRGINAAGQAVSGQSIMVPSINGQAQITLISGINPGPITLEAISDRADNNVDNGITEAVYNDTAVSVVTQVPTSATPVTISTTSLPAATRNIPYAVALQASGGTAPYTWQLVPNSSLPSGLYFSTSGVISGVPSDTTAGTYNIVVQAMDALKTVSKTQNLSITYTTPVVVATAPLVTTASLSAATTGTYYTTAIQATGGSLPYTWTMTPTNLDGLTLTGNTGVLKGTPTVSGTYLFTVTVTGSDGYNSSQGLSLTVGP
jgi:hypothetical protein